MFKRIAWILGLLAGLCVGHGAVAADAAADAAAGAAPSDQPDPTVARQGGALLDRMMPPEFKALWLDNAGGVASLHACEAYVSPEALQAWPGLIDFPYTTQPAAIVAYLPSDTPYGQDVFQAVRQDDGKWKLTRVRGSIATAAPSPAGLQAMIQSCLAHFGAIAPKLVYPTVYPPQVWPQRMTQAAAQ
ncbi:MAG TPA: hypothetical protein VF445_07460 [Bordetella sp.]|uniref:hypothetical protein n=1 Tax=Bordetella sp. TaxID=28081 RepID=UPI002ED4DB42